MTTPSAFDVVIVGGGIAGMATALGLIQRGRITNILLLEKANKLHPVGASIAVFSNGLQALRYLSPDIARQVSESCIPIESMIVKDLKDNIVREKKPATQVSYLVWYLLQEYLANGLPEGVLQLGSTLESFQVSEKDGIVTLTVRNRTSQETTHIQTRCLIGANGIHSPMRQALFGTDAVTKLYHGKNMYRAILPCSSLKNPPPRGVNVGYQGDEQGKLFSFRETASGILTVTAMACCDKESTNDAMEPQEKKLEMMRVFEEFPAPVQEVLSQLHPQSLHVQPIQDIGVLEGTWSKGPVIVIGDAAHAMSPSMGQGANQSLEDAAVLVHYLSKALRDDDCSPSSIASCLQQVYDNRIERVKRIHTASRTRSMMNNETTRSKPIDMSSEELQRVLQEIDEWKAPVETNE